MRDEKEERKKQARSNKQTRQSNTAHPRQSLFLEKMSCNQRLSTYVLSHLAQVGLEPTTLYTLDRALYQLSYIYMYINSPKSGHVLSPPLPPSLSPLPLSLPPSLPPLPLTSSLPPSSPSLFLPRSSPCPTDMHPSPLPAEEDRPVGMEALEALHNQIQILVRASFT